jgi:hypothetical protein
MPDVVFKQLGAGGSFAWMDAHDGQDGVLSIWTAPGAPGGVIEVTVAGLPPGVVPLVEITWLDTARAVERPGPSGANVVRLDAHRSRHEIGPGCGVAFDPDGAEPGCQAAGMGRNIKDLTTVSTPSAKIDGGFVGRRGSNLDPL